MNAAPLAAPRLRLAALGRAARRRAAFPLMLAALAWGVAREGMEPGTWRRTVRAQFWQALRQSLAGGLPTTLVAGSLTGLALVSQAVYWFGLAGQRELEGSVLVTVLVRQLTPLLIGFILLGRNGMATIAELGALQLRGQARAMLGQGLDPVALLILPRGFAYALAGFSLGVFFVLTALVVGFAAYRLLNRVGDSLWMFLDNVLTAMRAADFAIFPLQALFIGALVALTSCLTAMTPRPDDDTARLLSRGFVRGVIAIMLANLAFGVLA